MPLAHDVYFSLGQPNSVRVDVDFHRACRAEAVLQDSSVVQLHLPLHHRIVSCWSARQFMSERTWK